MLCYNIFDNIRVEIPKHQEQDKEAEQNRQIIKTKNSRREVTAYETHKTISAEKRLFPCAFLLLYNERGNVKKKLQRHSRF